MTNTAAEPASESSSHPRLLLPTLKGYRPRFLTGDVVAALTLVAIAVPEQMATAKLAGVAPELGLVVFVAGCVAFALLGTHRFMSVGADSTIAPIIASGALLVGATGSAANLSAVCLLGAMVGVLLIIVGVAKLGWVAEFLSTPAVTGIFCGIAIQIAAHQLPAVLGLPSESGTALRRLIQAARDLGHTQLWPALLALVVLVIAVVGERINPRLPAALIGVVVATAIVGLLHLEARGVAVVGQIDPSVHLPNLTAWTPHVAARLLPTALIIAFVCVVQTAATARSIEDRDSSLDRDMIAVGAGSLLAAGVGGFAVDASPPRTSVLQNSRGRSQMAGLIAAVVVVILLVGAAPLVASMPEAALGAILLVVASRLLKVGELRRIWAFDKIEFGVAAISLLAVVALGIEQAVVVAMVLAILDRTRKAARPRDTLLGLVAGTDHWVPVSHHQPTEQVPGVVVYLVYGPLWYADAVFIAGRIRNQLDAAPAPVHALVVDVDAVSDIDYTASQVMGELAADLRKRHITLALARASHDVRHDLTVGGLLADAAGGKTFESVSDAVAGVTE